MRKSIFIGVLALLLPIAAFAQVNATVSGTVTDTTGALIPGVEVTATNVNTGIATVQITNETGAYQFASLQPGNYRVSAALTSFQTQTYQNVLLSQGQQVRLNFSLEVAAAAGQTVEVTVDADATLATTSASVGDVLAVQEVQSLPLVVRDVLGLINATAGTAGRNFGGQGTRALNVTRDGLIINDPRYGTAAQNGTFVSSDLVEEVQVVVGNVDAEMGRGSGQVSLQTRSGTNQFHGAVFAFNSNSKFHAQNYFENLVGAKKSYINRNQFGGRLGGPIIRNKAFFFVLIDEQRWLQKENFVTTVLTDQARQGIFRYIAGQQNGNALSATPSVDLNGNILNPAALRSFNLFTDVQDPFRTGISTQPFWRDLLTRMPRPNDYTVGDGLNTAGFRWTRRMSGLSAGNNVGNENNRDQLNLRFDYQVNNANKLTFTTTREQDQGYRPDGITDWPGGVDVLDRFIPHLYTMAWISSFTPTVLNEMRFARKETAYARRSAFEEGCCYTHEKWDDRSPEAQKIYDLLPKSNGYPFFPIGSTTSFGAGAGLCCWVKHGFASTRGNKNPTQQFSDTVSWVAGPHSFKVGFDTVKNWSDGWNTTSEQLPTALLGNGNFPVTAITSARFTGLNANDINTATNILNDLSASVGGITFGRVVNAADQKNWNDYINGDFRRWRMLTQRDWALFFKDTWNVSTNLTLNLGVRYDKYGVLYEQNGMIARAKGGEKALYNYATNGTLTESMLVGPNSTNPNEQFYRDDWNNIGPTIGFSYKIPWFARTTVVRGGYGINYAGMPVILDFENDFGNSPGSVDVYLPATPYVPTVYTNFAAAVSGGAIPLPAKTQPGVIVVPLSDKTQVMNTPTDDRATPYIQSFNFSVQHDLSRGLSLELSYIGNKGTKLFDKRSLNEPNIFDNGILDAFNVTRAGGNAPLFNRILNGLTIPGGVGRVDGVNLTGSQAFRRWASTRVFLANGSVAQFANFVSTTSAVTNVAGGLLTNAGLPQSFITASPQFSNAVLWGTTKNSTYHSMQAQLRKQLSEGVTGQFTYTWSKALGDTVAGETGTTSIDPRNLSLNKGRQGFDQAHVFTGHGTWELPFGAGKALLGGAGTWVNRIVGGWQLSSIFSWVSGSPLTITSPNRTVGSISNLSLPDIVGDFPKSLGQVRVANRFVEYFPGISTVAAPTTGVFGSDPDRLASFATNLNVVDSSGRVLLTNPQPGKVGTLGTGWLEGPAQTQIDVSLAKRILIRENVFAILRADAVNAPNLTNWGDPNVNINSPNFGRITGLAGDATARRFTFTARLEF